jgi:NRPS condensation-like uncharacterized protein
MSEFDDTMELPASVRLSGCDYFLLASENGEARQSRAASNVCRIVIKLGARLDAEVLRRALTASPLLRWLGRIRYVPRFPMRMPLWTASRAAGGCVVQEHDSPIPQESDTCDWANMISELRFDSAPGFVFHLFQHANDKTTLLMAWHHVLMDAHGAESFLGLVGGSGNQPIPLRQLMFLHAQEENDSWLREIVKLPERLRIGRKSARYVARMTRSPFVSLLEGDSMEQKPSAHFHELSFDPGQTERIEAKSRSMNASFCDSLLYLAAAMRAVRAVVKQRGTLNEEESYVVPMPIDMRRRGARGPVLSNHLSFFFFRANPGDMDDLKDLVRLLAGQMKDQIRDEMPQAFSVMMDQFRRVPLPIYSKLLRGPTKGEIASFFFSYTGGISKDLGRFLGLPVEDIVHIPPLSCPPGLTIAFFRNDNRLRFAVSWAEGCLKEEEVALLERSICHDFSESHGQ